MSTEIAEYHFETLCGHEGDTEMEFRLTYEGPLPSLGSATDKLAIRRRLHPQLRELWLQDIHLNGWLCDPTYKNKPDELAHNYAVGDFNFVPLITSELGLACSLDILFLRRGELGSVVRNGGDLDNRIKTLLDALRTPDCRAECGQDLPTSDERPMYTLMSNDALIADLRVESDRLLSPTSLMGKAARMDSVLVIKVKTRIVDYYKGHSYPHFA